MSEPNPDLTPDQARARIDEIRASHDAVFQPADVDELHRLYQVVVAAPAPAQAAAALTPDQAKARIEELHAKSDPFHPPDVDELHALWRVVVGQGEDPTAAPVVVDTTLPASLPPLPDGIAWDEGLVSPLYEMARCEEVPPEVLAGGLAVMARLAEADVPEPAEALRQLRGRWGSDFDVKLAYARVATDLLPPAARQWLDDTALGDHPDLIDYMATAGEQLCDPRTGPGYRRTLGPLGKLLYGKTRKSGA